MLLNRNQIAAEGHEEALAKLDGMLAKLDAATLAFTDPTDPTDDDDEFGNFAACGDEEARTARQKKFERDERRKRIEAHCDRVRTEARNKS